MYDFKENQLTDVLPVYSIIDSHDLYAGLSG